MQINLRKGVFRVWAAGSIAWAVTMLADYSDDMRYTYRYYASYDSLAQEVAAEVVRRSPHFDRLMAEAAAIGGAAVPVPVPVPPPPRVPYPPDFKWLGRMLGLPILSAAVLALLFWVARGFKK